MFGYFHAVCAYVRMFYLAFMMVLFGKFDVVICDQVRVCVCLCVVESEGVWVL